IEEYPRPATGTWLLFGLGLGLSLGSRIMGGFAVLYALTALAVIVVAEARSEGTQLAVTNIKQFLPPLLLSAIVAYAAMALVWPWSALNPINPIKAAIYFSHFFEKPWRELFGGELILAPDMPRSYTLVLFGLQLPELFLALAIAGLA